MTARTLKSPLLEEDVTTHSLHMSDLSPTSELLLSPYPSSTDQGFTNESNGNFSRENNNHQNIDELDSYERKAFHHEKLPQKTPMPSLRNDLRTSSIDYYPMNTDKTPSVVHPRQDFQNCKPSSGLIRKEKSLVSGPQSRLTSSRSLSDHHLNGDHYGSFISNNKILGDSSYGAKHYNGLVLRYGGNKEADGGIFSGEYGGDVSYGDNNGQLSGKVKGRLDRKELDGGNVGGENFYGSCSDGQNYVNGEVIHSGEYGGEYAHDTNSQSSGKKIDGEMNDGGFHNWTVDRNSNDRYNTTVHHSQSCDQHGVGMTKRPRYGGRANIGSGNVPIGYGQTEFPAINRWKYNTSMHRDGNLLLTSTSNGDHHGKNIDSEDDGQKKVSGMTSWEQSYTTSVHRNGDLHLNGTSNGVGDGFSGGVLDRKQWTIEATAGHHGDSPKSQTSEDVLREILGRGNSKLKQFAEPLVGSKQRPPKVHDVVSPFNGTTYYHNLPGDSTVQTNVDNYYNKLSTFENEEETLMERGLGCDNTTVSRYTSGPRKGVRSKSSELPLRENTSVSMSYGLSKSWGSSKTRRELQTLKENVSRSERIAQMFRNEEEAHLTRARVFEEAKLLRKVFTAWFMKTRHAMISAEKMCKTHLLKKGMSALKCTVEYQRRIIFEFHQQQGKVVLVMFWQMWQHRTRERQRVKMQNTFTQWHYYKLHTERENLLDTMLRRHILSKNYSKWKARFHAQQKNSIASLHFKINLICQCWQSWALYTKQRRVKNHMNSVGRYRYGERAQQRLFQEWKDRTQKSLLCRRIARRRVLLKAFFQWKHWSQYAKIVHLRLLNMCKQYHKKTLMKHFFKKWWQKLNMKQAIVVSKQNQLSRAFKLWKLRFMRKKIHRHLCKALAKKAKKRRFFQKWTCFVVIQKETRSSFVKSMQDFYFRTVFNCWRHEAMNRTTKKKSLLEFHNEKSGRELKRAWESWKFQIEIVELKKRSRNNWSLRCVRRCCEVWKLQVRKVKLVTKLNLNRSIWETLMIKRFFRMWQDERERTKTDSRRSMYVGNILKKNSLARAFQAWRVVNQEECIIASTVQRRERKELARVYDAWCCFVSREKMARKQHQLKSKLVKEKTLAIWRHNCWSITKEREVVLALNYSKLQRHFMAWIEHVKDVQRTERLRAQKLETMMRKFVIKWRKGAEEKIERREKENGDKAYRRIILVSFFAVWKQRTTNQMERVKHMENVATKTYERLSLRKTLQRWLRQYTIEGRTREYLNEKRMEQLQEVFFAWRDFVNDEFEQQVCDFTANLLLDSSISTSGYQTSSFHFGPPDGEICLPLSSPRSRPITPTRSSDDSSEKLTKAINPAIFRPVTVERQTSNPGSQTPPVVPVFQRSQLSRQTSIDLLSHTGSSQPRSSEDDGVPSSGVHSAGEESDQDDRISINIAESLYSFQTNSAEGTPRDRELLVADTIIHWRSLSLSVAFRSWCKYTKHMTLIRELYGSCVIKNREKILSEMIRKWRRRLYVTVLSQQHWLQHTRKKYFTVWMSYRQLEILKANYMDQAQIFTNSSLLKRYFMKWKTKKTAKTQLQSILGRWQKNAVVTDSDKNVIHQFQQKEQAFCVKQAFRHWKQATRKHQRASIFCKHLLLQRYLFAWNSIACYQAEMGKKMKTFRKTHLTTKMFREWTLRYGDHRTAKILIGVSDERKIGKAFKAWHEWAMVASHHKKTSLAFHLSKEQQKLKAKFNFWLTAAKKLIVTRDHYNRLLQRRILRSWRNVLAVKATITGCVQDFQKIVQRNSLQTWFDLWRKRAQHCELLSDHLKKRTQRNLCSTFEYWKQQKRKRDATKHFSHHLKKKMLANWCQEISKRKKARQHFKTWHIIAEGTKEKNQVADSLLRDSEIKLLKKTFCFWKNATRHLQVAGYHHTTKLSRRFFLAWQEYTCSRKKLSSSLTEFQLSHQKNNLGLLEKYMKIWKTKSTFSTKADEIFYHKISSKYWNVWRHNFVRRKVSSAMVDHDNKKILSRVFISWYHVTSQNQLKKEVEVLRLKRWFRRWMARYNDT